MNSSDRFCVKWNKFHDNISSTFGSLREDTDFADVTLVCEDGQQVEAHKVILAASSTFFQNILKTIKHTHPLIYMKGMKTEYMLALLDFMYHGEANIYVDNLDSFLILAEDLNLKGISGIAQGIQTRLNTSDQQKEVSTIKREMETTSDYSLTENVVQEKADDSENDDKRVVDLMDCKVSVGSDELDEKIKSMMSLSGYVSSGRKLWSCKVCRKEGHWTNIKNHIELSHFEDISHPCNFCDKTFRTTNANRRHYNKDHKN